MDEELIPTFCAWQHAMETASRDGLQFHPEWAADFFAFLEYMGRCPEDGELVCHSRVYGYKPDNCSWAGMDKFPLSYTECPVSVGVLKAGLINEKKALEIAMLDMDPEVVRHIFQEVDASTAGQSQENRSAAMAAKVEYLNRMHGPVPLGEPTRWQIRNMCQRMREANNEAKLEECTEQLPQFAGDPRCRRGVEFVEDED